MIKLFLNLFFNLINFFVRTVLWKYIFDDSFCCVGILVCQCFNRI